MSVLDQAWLLLIVFTFVLAFMVFEIVTFDIDVKPIVLEEDVWLPNDVYVGPGVRIGRVTVLAARSIVFGDLHGGLVAAGMTARRIRDRVSDPIPSTAA